MQLRIGKRTINFNSWKRMLYVLCFCFVCIIDQRTMTCAPNGGGREIFRDLTGIVVAALILSHYKKEDIVRYKKLYIAWTILALAGLPVLFIAGKSWLPFLLDWLVINIELFVWGYVLIAVLTRLFIEKRRPKVNGKKMTVWLIMMMLMIFSRSDTWWPFCYFVMFGCLYMTDFDEVERKDLLQGALSGIILAFFIFQGHSFLFRPYDQVRYVGWYTNCNNNAVFYLSVLAAVLTKLYYVVKNQKSIWLRIYYFLGTGVVLSFIIMTIGRASWIASFVMIIFTICALSRGKRKRVCLQNTVIIILCVCITFPACFAAARYIPPLRHHPVWFEEEWNEGKVHSWDPWDSEKYIDWDEFFKAAGGRIIESFQQLFEHLVPALKVEAAEEIKTPIIADGDDYDGFIVRREIYKYFWNNLNWRGHKNDEIGVQLRSHYWVGHAHNIFLQFGTNFGIPVMVLFAVMLVWTLFICIKKWIQSSDERFVAGALWMLIPLLFGMFEFCWGAGCLTIFMIFFSWRNAILEES